MIGFILSWVLAGVREFEGRISRFQDRIRSLLEDASKARQRGREARELERLLEIRATGAWGYPMIAVADQRLAEIEQDRLARLYGILASEGTESPRRTLERLDELLEVSRGLDVEAWIRRHGQLLRRRVTVADRRG
ncbi:MAG: hypothetical protein KDC38_16970 [Planctomycetes bacterium]|nr:hypothetical protein [Planctomycetota bacterium]